MNDHWNHVTLCGKAQSEPVLSHVNHNVPFYKFILAVPRLSGQVDALPIIASGTQLALAPFSPGDTLTVQGQLRSYNKVMGGAGRLLLTAFAQRLLPPDDSENPNVIHLTGAICKPPAFRTTPFGREIADLMLAVNRAFGKSDYIPCIAWGRTARYAAGLSVGDHLEVQGRFQSREYQKQMPDGTVMNRMAYEVSISRLTCVKDMPLPAPAADRENAVQ